MNVRGGFQALLLARLRVMLRVCVDDEGNTRQAQCSSCPNCRPYEVEPASAAAAPVAKSRPVSTHSTASTVSSTPKKAVVINTWDGNPLMRRHRWNRYRSIPGPTELLVHPPPTLNIKLIDAELEKEDQTPVSPPPPVPVETLPVPISVPSQNRRPRTRLRSAITIRPKIRPEVISSSVSQEHKKTSSSASTSSVATLRRKNSTDTIKITKPSEASNNPFDNLSKNNNPQRNCNHLLPCPIGVPAPLDRRDPC